MMVSVSCAIAAAQLRLMDAGCAMGDGRRSSGIHDRGTGANSDALAHPRRVCRRSCHACAPNVLILADAPEVGSRTGHACARFVLPDFLIYWTVQPLPCGGRRS